MSSLINSKPLPGSVTSTRTREPSACGPHRVQVLRTYPAKRPAYPFAPEGERSVARAYLKALPRARRLVYLEDQYFWSERAAHTLADALDTPSVWPDRVAFTGSMPEGWGEASE